MLGIAAEFIGIIYVAMLSGISLVIVLVILAVRIPALLRYSGDDT